GMQNDISDPSSEFSWSFVNGELIFQDTSTDCRVAGFPEWYVPCGWANKHVWYITLDGVAPATFDPDTTGEFIEFEATLEMLPPTPLMNADRTVEAGLFLLERPVPRFPREVNNQGFWWADGLFMVANESAGGIGGEVAAFGGRIPFWAGGGVRYTGGPITLVFRYDGRRPLQDGRVQYEIRYQGQTTTSPWLVTGDASSTFNNGPHGLRMFRLGGYLQINIDGRDTNNDGYNDTPGRANAGIGGRVKWWNIKLTRNGVTRVVVGANRGDTNTDGCVNNADLLNVLFNFGTGCGN
ncbi:MAG: hypothetical protein NZ843_06100, partial [Fimbriimonadales bacterium]|nr:hypothetical protein [Fimbriimonadales bacterium]